MKKTIIALIYKYLDELNSQREIDDKLEKSEKTILYGQESGLDSIGLANLIIKVEGAVYKTFKVQIDMTNESVFSLNENPFRTVNSLAEYIVSLINEKKDNGNYSSEE
jgi:acyl carrier protein